MKTIEELNNERIILTGRIELINNELTSINAELKTTTNRALRDSLSDERDDAIAEKTELSNKLREVNAQRSILNNEEHSKKQDREGSLADYTKIISEKLDIIIEMMRERQ